MGIYKRGRIWWMAYTVAGHKVNESTHSNNRRIAQRAFDRRAGEICEGRLQLPRLRSAPTVSEWAEHFLSGVSDANTKKRYRSSVNKLVSFFGDRRISEVAADEIDEYVTTRKSRRVSAATINRDLAVLRRMLRLAQKRRFIVFNPFEQVELLNETRNRRQARILSFAEESRILAVIPQDSYFSPLVRILLDTGLRVYSEALRLKWSDVDFEAHLLHVRHSKTAAGIRSVPLTPNCEATLRAWGKVHGGNSEFVFPNFRKGDAHLRDIHRSWKALLVNSGVPDTWLHDLRATFATRLSACGLSVFQIAQLLGHSSGRIIGTYAKAFDEGKREAINLLHDYCQSRTGSLLTS